MQPRFLNIEFNIHFEEAELPFFTKFREVQKCPTLHNIEASIPTHWYN